ncbi:MAG: 2-oxoacid:acceptor oxidoreductase family protein, partial [Promethearchaeota archaeon]
TGSFEGISASTSMKDNYNLLCVGIGGTGVIRASMILGWAALKEGFKVRTAETHGMSQRGGSVSSYLRFGKNLEGPFMMKGDVDVLLSFEISEALRNVSFTNKDSYIITSNNAVVPPSVLTHRSLKIDGDKCIGCGNCLAHCIPNRVYNESTGSKHEFTLIKGPTRQIRNGYSLVLDSCTGCMNCIIDEVCPFGAIVAYNEWEYAPIKEIENDLKKCSNNAILVDANKLALEAGNILAANVVIIGILAGTGKVPLKKETMRETVRMFVPKKALEVNMKAFDIGLEIGINYMESK